MSHARVPQPMTLTEPLDFEDAREAMKALAEQRKKTRGEFEQATGRLVDAEREYRKGRALARVKCEGSTAADRKDEIDAATADLRHVRDGAEWAVKICQEKLQEIDAQRASVHRLVEWSMRLDPFAQEQREPRAGLPVHGQHRGSRAA